MFVAYIYTIACAFILILEFWLMRPVKHPARDLNEAETAGAPAAAAAMATPYNVYNEQVKPPLNRVDSNQSVSLQMISHNTMKSMNSINGGVVHFDKQLLHSSQSISSLTFAQKSVSVVDEKNPKLAAMREDSKDDRNNGYVINLESVRRLFSRTGSSFFLRFGLLSKIMCSTTSKNLILSCICL